MLGFAQTQQGSALHPPGALPLDPATFEKVDETFILPCPNIFTGGMNFHGKFEYCSLTTMRKAQQVILNLATLWSE